MACKVFSSHSCVKINQHKDLSIIAPIYYVTVGNETSNLSRGDLVFPVCKLLSTLELTESEVFKMMKRTKLNTIYH